MLNYDSLVEQFKAMGRNAIPAKTDETKVGESAPKAVENVDIMFQINRYFDTVSDEDFLKHLKEAGFTVILRKGKRVGGKS